MLERLVDTLAALITRVAGWERARQLLWLGILVALGVAVGLTAAASEVYEAVEDGNGVAAFDRPVLDFCMRHRRSGFTRAVVLFSISGGPVWMPVICGTLVTLLAIHRRSFVPVVTLAIAAAGSLAMTTVGKLLLHRARPPLVDAVPPYEYSFSFPSGHSLNSLVLAGTFCYLLLRGMHRLWTRAAVVAITCVYVLAMGLSRVFLGHHWLTDVIAAWLLGLAWLSVVVVGHAVWRRTHPLTRQPTHREPEILRH